MRAIGLYFMAVVFSLMASIERTLTLPVLVGGIYSVMKNNTGLIDINKGLDLFEGDIKLPPKYDKSGVIDPGYRWTIPVPLEFDSSLGTHHQNMSVNWMCYARDLNARGVITKALEQFRLKTCIDFKIRDTEMHYVKIVKDNGCYGYVGNYYMAGQPLSIGDGCDSIAIVEHEMLHTLGFWHEQSRPDRDDHISILWNNIEEGKENNFEIKEYAEATTQGTAYDYKSLMHYDKDSFSNGWGDTIYTKKQEFQNIIGQRQDFSPTDVLELNLLYGCSTSSTVTFLDGCNFEEDMCDMRACSTAESRWKAVSSIVGGPTEDHSIPQDQGGSTADYWQLQHIQLYTTKAFLIEFESVKGEGMSSGGFSLDDINLSETTCPHSVWHIRNFAEHLQQSGVFSFSPRLYSTEGYSYQVLVSYGPEALGVFFWLVSGVYDNSLQWPCPSRQITIELLEQTSSILKRMSKQISVTLDTTETFTINGQTFYKWDNPLIFGKQYEDSEGWYYAGPLIGDGNFISKERIMAGDFIRGGDAFLLISFEDVLAQPSPILPTPMSVTYDSFTPSPADNLSPCVYYECDFVSVNRTAVCIPSHFIAFLAFIVTVILSIH
ncbi:meprin A subunit beta-like isoform X4 [Alosa sapidissima]|uniref:meprin A subunit beta-like isoform X4 n=1 Tax=Alosa sapidissima TaxID=34773 RepID=UPI001C0A24B6|nr:meprin A subunit beta-like isoform X4 [Alosa sapidissima]